MYEDAAAGRGMEYGSSSVQAKASALQGIRRGRKSQAAVFNMGRWAFGRSTRGSGRAPKRTRMLAGRAASSSGIVWLLPKKGTG